VPGGLRRWFYQGRRHQRRLLPRHSTAAALLGTAVVALLVILVVAVWPGPRRHNVVLPGIPHSTPTGGPTLAAPTNPDASPTGEPSATAVPSQPPLPTDTVPTPTPPQKPVPNPPQQPPQHNISPIAIEAESAANTLFGAARIRTNRDASNDHTIGFLGTGNGESGALRINGLTVPVRGTYTLSIFYIAGDGDRSARIAIDGTVAAVVTFPSTGDWHTVGSLTLRVNLAAGANNVQFDNPVDFAPDIDRVILSN
jgi:hypothetical protein